MTPVKDQGQCGSVRVTCAAWCGLCLSPHCSPPLVAQCWAFSATEEIETDWIMAGNSMVELSPEQIVDCDTAGQDQGCNGGYSTGAYAYVEKYGLETEAAYPYT